LLNFPSTSEDIRKISTAHSNRFREILQNVRKKTPSSGQTR